MTIPTNPANKMVRSFNRGAINVFHHILLCLSMLLSLSACSATIEELRAAPAEQGTFKFDIPYATVFERFSHVGECKNARSMYIYVGTPVPVKIDRSSRPADAKEGIVIHETTPGKEAQIDVSFFSPFTKRALVSVNLQADGSETSITYFGQSSLNSRNWRDRLESFVREGSCL